MLTASVNMLISNDVRDRNELKGGKNRILGKEEGLNIVTCV